MDHVEQRSSKDWPNTPCDTTDAVRNTHVSTTLCLITPRTPWGKVKNNNDMRGTPKRPFLYICYMIFQEARGDLQTSHLFWYKAEISRNAKTNSDLWLLLRRRAIDSATVLAFRPSAEKVVGASLGPADHQAKDSGPVGTTCAMLQ